MIAFESRRCRIARRDLAYVHFILESYEGLAVMSTLDKAEGIVEITFHPAFAAEVEGLLAALAQEVSLVPLAQHSSPEVLP